MFRFFKTKPVPLGKPSFDVIKTRGECQRQTVNRIAPSFVGTERYAQTRHCVTEKKGGPERESRTPEKTVP